MVGVAVAATSPPAAKQGVAEESAAAERKQQSVAVAVRQPVSPPPPPPLAVARASPKAAARIQQQQAKQQQQQQQQQRQAQQSQQLVSRMTTANSLAAKQPTTSVQLIAPVPPRASDRVATSAAIREARRGLLRTMMEHFSSTPITDPESMQSFLLSANGEKDKGPGAPANEDEDVDHVDVLHQITRSAGDRLTAPEKEYLRGLLQSGDIESLQQASLCLADPTLFPKQQQQQQKDETNGASQFHCSSVSGMNSDCHSEHKQDDTVLAATAAADVAPNMVVTQQHQHVPIKRRDSQIQQQLFKLHEARGDHHQNKNNNNSVQHPSHVLFQQMALVHQNSLLQSSEADNLCLSDHTSANHSASRNHNKMDLSSTSLRSKSLAEATMFDGSEVDDQLSPTTHDEDDHEEHHFRFEDWNPFKEMSTWLDGGEGVEVNPSGVPLSEPNTIPSSLSRRLSPFKILGTSADDISCHPHVLSPPCMESLLAFVPESLTDSNFWLKYSLVRDGASLWKLLRQVRASSTCILAIETVDGHVFGAFTSQAWRLAQGWYGGNESFLWKMRRSRLEATRSIVQQVCQESEIQVYPYRTGNVAVQYCSKDCLMMGQGELLPSNKPGKHYGHAIYLEADLLQGSTSTSETFGNPCLVDGDLRGARFEVSNLEVWTLTPHETVAEAEQSELSMLFLTGGRSVKNLNLMDILVGGPI